MSTHVHCLRETIQKRKRGKAEARSSERKKKITCIRMRWGKAKQSQEKRKIIMAVSHKKNNKQSETSAPFNVIVQSAVGSLDPLVPGMVCCGSFY